MVKGIRSPVSLTRMMTNWPGLAFLAIKGASMILLTTVPWAISSFCRISNTGSLLFVIYYKFW